MRRLPALALPRKIFRRLAVMISLMLGAFAAHAESFPHRDISKATSRHEWPFSVEAGRLICVAYAGQYHVFFAEPDPARTSVPFQTTVLPRKVVVSTNPFALMVSLEDRALYAPFESLEQLIRRLAPFEMMGKQLCMDMEKSGKKD
jgi:hypothetical protein